MAKEILAFGTGILMLSLFVLLPGCQKGDQIVVHRLPKQTNDAREGPDRMIVGMGFHKGSGWYFKLVGQEKLIDEHADEFRTFLRSIKFADEGLPAWTAPESWNEIPGGGGMRKATFLIGEEELELAVTSFPFVGSMDEGLLLNVNRWRGHMTLNPIAADEVNDQLEKLSDANEEILVMDVVGEFNGGMSGGSAPFAHAGGNTRPPSRTPPSDNGPTKSGPTVQRPELDFELPDGWEKAAGSMFSLYAFDVADDDGKAKLSISAMTKTNTWESSLGMWKDQVGQGGLSDEDAEKKTESVTIDGVEGRLISLDSPADSEKRQAMIAVRVESGQYAWFFKLSGDPATIENEREDFAAFLKSVKFK